MRQVLKPGAKDVRIISRFAVSPGGAGANMGAGAYDAQDIGE